MMFKTVTVDEALEKWCADNNLIPRLKKGDTIICFEDGQPIMRFVEA